MPSTRTPKNIDVFSPYDLSTGLRRSSRTRRSTGKTDVANSSGRMRVPCRSVSGDIAVDTIPELGFRHASVSSESSFSSLTSLSDEGPSPRNKDTSHLAHPLPPKFTISGRKLQPTVIFDTFWRFVAERKAIDDRRRAGESQPWTQDQFMQKLPFCNAYRVLDRTSQYIISHVIEQGSQDPTEVVFRVVLFNTFTRIETYEALQRRLGPLTWARYDHREYEDALDELKAQGKSLYTGSFQKPGPKWDYQETHKNHLLLLETLMSQNLPQVVSKAAFMADIYEFIVAFPGMGEFSAYQLLLNLSYSSVMNFSENDFVVAGLGAKSGLKKLFGRKQMEEGLAANPGFDVEVIRWMAKTQRQHFRRLGLDFIGLGPKGLPLALCDIEHAVCEVDKYARLAHPNVQGDGGRTQLRGSFTPSPDPYPAKPRLPKAWSHPDRRIVRIRPGGPPVIDKRYVVERIGAHKQGKYGPEYYVFWYGYAAKDATWESEESLMEQVPDLLTAYLHHHRLAFNSEK